MAVQSNPSPPHVAVAEVSKMDAGEARWWRAYRDERDTNARELLIELHLPYARVVAASYYARRTHDEVEFAEYLQLASLGLLESIDRYDPMRGVQFRTFAARRMHGSILNGLERATEKNQQIAVRKRLQQERLEAVKANAASKVDKSGDRQDDLFRYLAEIGVGIALGVLLEGTGMIDADSFGGSGIANSPEVSYFRQNEIQHLQQLIRDLVKRLTQQEQTVIRYHYLQETPFDEIALHMGLTKGRISQIHRAALFRLRDVLSQSQNCNVSL